MKSIHAPRPPSGACNLILVAALLAGSGGCNVSALGGQAPLQPATSAMRATSRSVAPGRWSVVSPAGALAWFDLLADLRLPGAGAFPLVEVRSGAIPPGERDLASALARTRESEILHFAPLYHPSADRAALAAALRGAARTPARPPTPRAALLVGALARTLSTDVRSARLPELAVALERRSSVIPPAPARLAVLQRELDSLYLPALSRWFTLERLDAGRLIVAPGIGTEGRIFAGTSDRTDNQVAVGDFASDADASAPLLAFVREVCFPAITRATQGVVGFEATNADGARRASLAAVRCGAALLDARLPSRADAYRAFWLRRAAAAPGAPAATGHGDRAALQADFERAFPRDPAIAGAVDRAVGRVREVR